MIGREVGGRYFIVEKVGGGGGSLYLAKDLRTGKRRAVKILTETSQKEAALLCDLDHPMLPQMIDCVAEGDCVFLVMEYLQGENLKELLKRHGPWQEKQVLSWARELCTVMEYLHSRKPPVIHGDIKPENLMLTREGRLYLVDLGSAAKGYRTDLRQCTGTKGYAAPEQYRGELYPASDLYAFGKTMEELLEGHGGRCARIFRKCCREKPEERWQSFQVLERKLAGAGRTGTYKMAVIGGSLGLTVLGTVMWKKEPTRTIERLILVPVTVTTAATETMPVTQKVPAARKASEPETASAARKASEPEAASAAKTAPVTKTVSQPEASSVTGTAPAAKEQAQEETDFLEELTELQPLLKEGLQQSATKEGQHVLEEALRKLRKMEEIYEEQESWCRVRLLRIQAEEAGGRAGAALALYEEALEKYPDERELYSQFGCWLCGAGETVRSEVLYHQAQSRFGQLDTYLEERWKEMLDEERKKEDNKKRDNQE